MWLLPSVLAPDITYITYNLTTVKTASTKTKSTTKTKTQQQWRQGQWSNEDNDNEDNKETFLLHLNLTFTNLKFAFFTFAALLSRLQPWDLNICTESNLCPSWLFSVQCIEHRTYLVHFTVQCWRHSEHREVYVQVYVRQPSSHIQVMDIMDALNLDPTVGIILSPHTPSPNIPAANIRITIYLPTQNVVQITQ